MTITDKDIYHIALQIRQQAALHQQGVPVSEVRAQVDRIIQAASHHAGSSKAQQVEIWTSLLDELTRYITKMSSPAWLTVITHARSRVKTRRNTARTGI